MFNKLQLLKIFLICFCLHGGYYVSGQKNREQSADILQFVLPGMALGSTIIWNDDSKPIFQFLKTIGTMVVITHSVKGIVNKKRPNGGKYSFPSGHTAYSFSGAAFLERRFGWKVGVPAYLIASYVGWSRVNTKNHDYWDVLAGSIIGIGSAYLFTKPYNGNKVEVSVFDIEGSKHFLITSKFQF